MAYIYVQHTDHEMRNKIATTYMDYIGLVWLDPLSCKTLLQAIWPCTGSGYGHVSV